jgi:hypothetical protein
MRAPVCSWYFCRLFGHIQRQCRLIRCRWRRGMCWKAHCNCPAVMLAAYCPLILSLVLLQASVVQDTQFPYGSTVSIALTMPAGGGDLDLALRIPAWVTSPVKVTVDGAPWPEVGTAASYLHLQRQWNGGLRTILPPLLMRPSVDCARDGAASLCVQAALRRCLSTWRWASSRMSTMVTHSCHRTRAGASASGPFSWFAVCRCDVVVVSASRWL